MSHVEQRPLTGAERARRFREKRHMAAVPTDVQFDREVRMVLIDNIANDSLTPARVLNLVRERLRKRFSLDGIDSVIAKYGER